MISKWAFTHAKIARSLVNTNVKRWIAPVITLDTDQEKYDNFLRNDRSVAYLLLITCAPSNTFNDIAISALNKFTSLNATHPFAPPPHDLSILRGIQIPQNNIDRFNQQIFFNSVRENMEIAKTSLKNGVSCSGLSINEQFSDPITRAICHVSSALIPNVVCVIDNPSVYTDIYGAVKEQLEVLGLGETVDEANNKGIIVRSYTILK
jgi:hypothetical protein